MSRRIVKIKQVDLQNGTCNSGHENVKSNGDFPSFVYIRMSLWPTITSQECDLGVVRNCSMKTSAECLLVIKSKANF